jgi:hypothetical protein
MLLQATDQAALQRGATGREMDQASRYHPNRDSQASWKCPGALGRCAPEDPERMAGLARSS